jgi:uncharacterized protein (TIGR02594 family)
MLALQIVACAVTLLAVWLIGNKHVSGPALNAVAALCFAVLNASADLWICAAFSAAMAAVNVRNFFRWRRDGRALAMIVAIVGLFLAAPPAFAKPHHRHHRHHHHRVVAPAPERSFFDMGSDVVSAARAEIGKGAIYGRSSLWCARFMNAILQRSGYHGTGSDMAASFASMPRTTAHVGAIAVMSRRGGGHVGVVSGFDDRGNPIIISGNHGNRVAETVYPRGRVYAFVVPQ